MGGAGGQKKLINLLRGWPSPNLLPAELLKTAASRALSNPEIFVPGLQYGPDPGYQPLRKELAKFLSDFYSTTPDAERICITGGASQSVACILQSFTEPVYTQAVWVIAPCYYLACPIFEDSGFKNRLKAVPEDDEGVDLEWLEKGLQSFEASDPGKPVYKQPNPFRKAYRHIVYVVPTCSNPSGKTMSLRRRKELVQLARKYNALVICDDVYDFLQWPIATSEVRSSATSPPPSILPRLSDIDFAMGPSSHDPEGQQFGHAISNGSFSKIVGPGIRTGWVEGTRDFAFGLAQTGSTKSGGAPSQFGAMTVCEMMKSGDLARHLEESCRPALQHRHRLMMDAIHEHLGPFGIEVMDSNVKDVQVYGGYFVWITFPDGPTAQDIAERASEDENLIVPPGEMFEVKGDEETVKFENSIRLCYSWEEEDDMVEGVRRLGRVIKALRSEGPRTVANKEAKKGGLDAFF
ncbi:putative aminotransferase protein [Phaeoacremonium minimum UCRPA7]|uniref:Putative aminotransferase protein n=1 Tax=Phaeoacremonium minimum (strain UCR-PA7) TaxID=1286976 RepID=R8BWV7_PHAM7|nr:putative aminotransferase protein [Phaeoacremonium minimum UCRPA7]EOO03820.1 putative aminotransferase protein [Phaeoacremonium minimum UCRPA7]